jgi:GT2 family glycosyltransferase/lipopolysaccharide/colanic/teichoic acid biosynthesis glycosyltransferase
MIKISIIIVNYNVKDFLEQALISIKRSLENISSEIFVVDNDSSDESIPMIKERFPEVILIENKVNSGFSAANNLAIARAKGEFIVLINPDTVVQEDTFVKLLEFFDEHPQASAATCKILNPDGTFSVDSRHSIPTPMTAFWKLIGFNKLFPKSKIFARYNLTFLSEDDIHKVEAISGSFMMMRKDMVDKVGSLDERFFMYCEDIDYCHRINQAGGDIYYVPTSQIIHYKGESTKKNNIDYVYNFNKSLYLFYKKHYQKKYMTPIKWLILLGVIIRGSLIFTRNNLKQYFPIIIDLIVLNLSIFLSFYIRFEMRNSFSLDNYLANYYVINIISSLIFLISSLFFEGITKYKFSFSRLFKANVVTMFFVTFLTFFFRDYAFSRVIILMYTLLSFISMSLWRLTLLYFRKKLDFVVDGNLFSRRALIVGSDMEVEKLLKKLLGWGYSNLEVLGVVSLDKNKVGGVVDKYHVVTSLDRLPEYIRLNKVNTVIFPTHEIPFAKILETMVNVNNANIEFKMVPEHLEYMIGKSQIDHFEDVELLDVEYAYGKLYNRFMKRLTDLIMSFSLIIVLSPLLIALLIKKQNIERLSLESTKIARYKKRGILRFYLDLFNILLGKISFVGAPIIEKNVPTNRKYFYKPGLTGLVQINKLTDLASIEKVEIIYLKNYSLALDMKIILKTLIK